MTRLLTLIGLALLTTLPATAQRSPRQLGPFTLGQTRAQFEAAAKAAGMTKPRVQLPQERDMMGLGLTTVRPISTAARLARPEPGKIWGVTGLLLGDRIAYLSMDYAIENKARLKRWHDSLGAPANARRALVDGAWARGGVVLYADRWGQSLHAVDWIGLTRSSRVSISLDGAINNANEFFRRLYAREAEISVEHIRRSVVAWFDRRGPDGKLLCTPPASVGFSPAETPCDLPEKRFGAMHGGWAHSTWSDLKINRNIMSRFYSYSIESSGSFSTTRVTILARGDIDCDGDAATLRVTINAGANASTRDCLLNPGEWQVINPFD